MKVYFRVSLLILFIISFGSFTKSQIKSIGVPFIKNYEKNVYSAATQNWDIAQDNRGILYFANNEGVLEFDGVNWRLYPISNLSIPRCLHIDKKNRIWVGAYNEFGYLKIDGSGEFAYYSIKNLVPENYKNFGEIWNIHETPNGIYFQAFDVLFLYDFSKIKIIEDYTDYHFSFYVNKRFFIQDKKDGLKELRGEKLYLIEGGEMFKTDIEVWQMIPFSVDTILIATQQNGLFLYDGYKIQKYDFKLNDYLIDKQVFSLQKIHNKYLAFGTIQSGLIITDFRGNLIQHVNKSKGLQNNTILSLFEDSGGQIWLGLDNGIDYVEINSAFTFLNDAFGIEGTGYTSKLFNESLYLGTNQGLYHKKWADIKESKAGLEDFSLVENTRGQVWSLESFDGDLFCGHNMGTFIADGQGFRRISDEKGGWTFLKPDKKTEHIIGGTYASLTLYKKNEVNNWSFERNIGGLHESLRQIEKDSLNNLWISHGSKGVFKIKLSNDFTNVENVKLYNSVNGLPSDIGNYVFKLYDKVIVCANSGVYQYNYASDRFEESTFFNQLLGSHNKIRAPKLDESGNIWFYKNSHPALLKKDQSSWQLIEAPFLKYDGIFVSEFEDLEVIDNENILFGTENGFIHFDPSLIDTSLTTFSTLIRQVKLTKPNDSLIYNGNVKNDSLTGLKSFPYRMNAIKFSFVAPFFESPERTLYRFKLEGFDKNWSAWRRNTEKEYTNLPAESYTFLVESKNILGQIGTEASFSFIIRPPWYRTYWALAGYLIIFIIGIYLLYIYLKLRFDIAKRNLKKREEEKLQKKEEEFAKENLLKEQKIITLKNEKLESEVLQRKTQMELKNKELASVAIQITHKNEILSNLKAKIETISVKVNNQAQLELRQLIKAIDEDLKLDKDWDQFKMHFEEVHSDFFKRLRDDYNDLTPKDLKMCAYLRMNLSTKEIAPLMNISVRGVEISRYRLRKKLGLQKDANLIEFMLNL